MKRHYFVSFILIFFFSVSCARKNVDTSNTATGPSETRGNNFKIGVILPLTGRQAVYGSSTLHGLECADGVFLPCEGPIKAELVIKDDASEPERAVSAVEDLVKNDGVSIIIGPLSSSSVEVAAKKAQELGVPLISLSQREGVTQIGDYVFSVALTATSQVKAVVDWAVRKKKIKRFAIIYPMNAYGESYKNLFQDLITDERAQIVMSEKYGETTLDFGGVFRKTGKKFDALFVPDSYRAVGYIAPLMFQEGIEGVQLLGTSRWNNNGLIDRGGDALEGAVFVDGFFDESKVSSVQRFNGVFKQAYGMNPTILEALSFDAARLAMKALQNTGGKHPKDVRDMLVALSEVEGAVGGVGFDSNREVIRRLFMLTVKNGKIVEMEGFTSPRRLDKYGAPVTQPQQPYQPDAKY